MLSKRDKNRLIKVLEENGFNLKDFVLRDEKLGVDEFSRLSYRNNKFFFDFMSEGSNFDRVSYRYSTFSRRLKITDWLPDDDDSFIGSFSDINYTTFDQCLVSFKDWLSKHLQEYIYEVNEVDLWVKISNNTETLDFNKIDFEDSSTFSEGEKEQIKLGLNEAKLLLSKNFDLDDVQLELVSGRLKYLEEALDRTTKTDWKGIAVSAIIGLIFSLSVDTETGKSVWELFNQVFENLPSLPF